MPLGFHLVAHWMVVQFITRIIFWLEVLQSFIRHLSFGLSPFYSCAIEELCHLNTFAATLCPVKCQNDESPRNVVKQMWNTVLAKFSFPASQRFWHLRAKQGFAWGRFLMLKFAIKFLISDIVIRLFGILRNFLLPKIQWIFERIDFRRAFINRNMNINTNMNTNTNRNSFTSK